MYNKTPNHLHQTVISISNLEKILWGIGFSVLGATLGYFLLDILSWAVTIEILPYKNRISFIMKFTNFIHSHLGSWSNFLVALIGLFIGIYLAKLLLKESPTIVVSGHSINIISEFKDSEFTKREIKDIYFDHEDCVIVDLSGRELLRKSYDLNKNDLKNALRHYDYPLHSEDPYRVHFRLWICDTQELPVHVNALLKAREVSKKNNDEDEVIGIRKELSKLRIIVKDSNTEQYWRPSLPIE